MLKNASRPRRSWPKLQLWVVVVVVVVVIVPVVLIIVVAVIAVVVVVYTQQASRLLLLLSWWARQALPIWGDRCPEEMRKSTRLWIRRDPSLPRDSWQPFYWLGYHSRAAVVAHGWCIVDHCQTIDVDGCRQTAKLQSVLRLCSGFYQSKDPTNSI